MNCSWDVSQVIYLFHSYSLFLKCKGQAIYRVIFAFLGNSANSMFFSNKPFKELSWWKKIISKSFLQCSLPNQHNQSGTKLKITK